MPGGNKDCKEEDERGKPHHHQQQNRPREMPVAVAAVPVRKRSLQSWSPWRRRASRKETEGGKETEAPSAVKGKEQARPPPRAGMRFAIIFILR